MCFERLDHIFNPIALRKAKIVYNFGLSEFNRVKGIFVLGGKEELTKVVSLGE